MRRYTMCCENDHLGYWPREKQMKSYVLRGEQGTDREEKRGTVATIETRIYRIVNNQIVGELPISSIRRDGYYHNPDDPDLGLAEASNYLIRENRYKRRQEGVASVRNAIPAIPMTPLSPQFLSDQRDSLSSLIERARQEQRIAWQ